MSSPGRPPHRSSAVPLAWAWWALIVYASLFPFTGWRWPPGMQPAQLWLLPWPRYFIPFDITSNLLAYGPMGWLICVACLRHGLGLMAAAAWALALGSGLSYAMEVTQHLLPTRVPSSLDWLLNTLGALGGALAGVVCQRTGLLARWQAARERWLDRGNGGALALLVLWPVALLFPTPLPLAVGQVSDWLRRDLAAWLADVPWASGWHAWLATASPSSRPLSLQAEVLVIMLGLLGPCLLAYAAARPGWRRMGLAVGAALAGVLASTLSTVLNFGPDHALAWRTPGFATALVMAGILALAGVWLPARRAAALALLTLVLLVVLVQQAPTDPYFAQSLQGWEQGRFVRFHGLAQWVGWWWPFAAIVWLAGRLIRR